MVEQKSKRRRWRWLGGSLLAVVIALLGLRAFAAQLLKDQILAALGPESELRAIHLDWRGAVIEGLVIHAPRDWPAQETLRAERVTVVPALRSLFSERYRVERVEIEQAYLSALRPRRGGFRVLPSLLEKPKAKAEAGAATPTVEIAAIELRDSVLEFYDASVRRPAHKLRLEQLAVRVEDLRVPALDRRMPLQLDGVVKGPQQDGQVRLRGWLVPATQESSIRTELVDIDLKALEPYLLQASEAGVKRGRLSMQLQSDVRGRRLKAPGTLSLVDLELSSGGGMLGTFMGVPRSAVLAALRDRDGRIDLQFSLDGDLDNPQFSLNESLSKRLAYGMAQGLGLSLAGVAKDVGTLGQKGIEAVGDAAKGLGRAVGGMFGGDDDD